MHVTCFSKAYGPAHSLVVVRAADAGVPDSGRHGASSRRRKGTMPQRDDASAGRWMQISAT